MTLNTRNRKGLQASLYNAAHWHNQTLGQRTLCAPIWHCIFKVQMLPKDLQGLIIRSYSYSTITCSCEFIVVYRKKKFYTHYVFKVRQRVNQHVLQFIEYLLWKYVPYDLPIIWSDRNAWEIRWLKLLNLLSETGNSYKTPQVPRITHFRLLFFYLLKTFLRLSFIYLSQVKVLCSQDII